ncbi:hypothetical protein [Carnobacterium maltaromaticum]|uniref:hypothetical protein n=1 Tax=Carnobacterium maltaromaticum TaxID=2751 RepID=UPI0039AF1ADF
MKKIQIVGFVCISLMVLGGCGTKNEDVKKESTSEMSAISSEDKNSKNETNSESSSEVSSEVSSSIVEESSSEVAVEEVETKITDAKSATEYLLKQLNMGPDIQGSGEENSVTELEKDDKGDFYTIRLVSLELKNNGGSGTIGRYKVYLDGNYELLN